MGSDETDQDRLLVSALTGEGIEALVAAIGKRLAPDPPPAGAAVPFWREQFERLSAIHAALVAGDASRAQTMLTDGLQLSSKYS